LEKENINKLGDQNMAVVNLEMTPKRNESQEAFIKRFTKKVKKEGILDEYKEKRFYKKPSQVRREKAIRRKRLIEKSKLKVRK